MGLYGARADAELLGDLRGWISLDAELEDLPLARGERRQGRTDAVVSAAQTAVVGDDETGYLGREIRLTPPYRTDRFHDFRCRLRFARVAEDSGLQRIRAVRLVGDHAEGEQAPFGILAQQLARDADPADAGKHHVEQ